MKQVRVRKHALAGAVIAALLLTACGGDDDAQGPAVTSGPTETPTSESETPTDETEPPTSESEPTVPGDVAPEATASSVPATTASDVSFDPEASLSYASGVQVGVSLDPHAEVAIRDFYTSQYIYDRLTQIDANVQLQPMLATSWEFSDDGLALTMTLRTDAVFHDGSPVDAAAVKASLDRAKTSGGPVVTGLLDSLDSVDVVDASTVRLNLNRFAAELPYNLSRSAGAVVNPKAIEQGLDLSLTDHGIAGSGPYVVSDGGFKPEVEAHLTRASTPYWDPEAGRIKNINTFAISDPTSSLNALQSGEVDGAAVRAADWDAAEGIGGHTLYRMSTGLLQGPVIKSDRPNVSDVRVRQAIAHAIDRVAIADGLLLGRCQVTDQPFVEGAPGFSDELAGEAYPYDYDVEAAKQLLADAGFADGLDLVGYVATGLEPQNSIAIAVQNQLAAIGINMELQSGPGTEGLQKMQAGEIDLFFPGLIAQPHPAPFVARVFYPGSLYQAASGPEGDALRAAVDQSLDPSRTEEQTGADWYDIGVILRENVWVVPLCFSQQGYSFPDDVGNVETMGEVWNNAMSFRYLYRAAD